MCYIINNTITHRIDPCKDYHRYTYKNVKNDDHDVDDNIDERL